MKYYQMHTCEKEKLVVINKELEESDIHFFFANSFYYLNSDIHFSTFNI